jgi:uncharacterized membrane protein
MELNGFAATGQFWLTVLVVLVCVAVGIWDAYMIFQARNDLTVTAVIRAWTRERRIVVIAAAFLFYHLFVEV